MWKNIGFQSEPKNIKLSKLLPQETKHRYVKLFKECIDAFAWRYEDLKTYDTTMVEHKNPLKLGTKPLKNLVEANKSHLVTNYRKRD